MHNFKTFSDYDLAEWFCQYGDGQAGYYPGLRRTRNAAAKELIYRGINPGKIRRGDQLGCWQAESAAEALEMLAKSAGYASKEEADKVLQESGGNIYPEKVEEITEEEYNAVEALLAAGYSDQGDALRDYREAVDVGDTWMLDTIVSGSLDEWKGLTLTEFNQALSNANHDPFPAFETSVETDAAYDAAWNRLQREGIIAAIEDYNEGRPDHMHLHFGECKEDFVDPDAGEWKPYGAWNYRWDLMFVCGTIEECRTMLGRIEADEALQSELLLQGEAWEEIVKIIDADEEKE